VRLNIFIAIQMGMSNLITTALLIAVVGVGERVGASDHDALEEIEGGKGVKYVFCSGSCSWFNKP
jgi:hypothetical protein